MLTYRDPDDMPVDPEAIEEGDDAAFRRPTPPWRPVDPDSLRPARLPDDDGPIIDDDPAS